ncbi:phytase [Magnaporthiopsis poae ATCC 64411]|uniref:3-phytase n=1 Tax=Magnaporthiopsis poae (strain ATCC 64411 / 73-15) TaxID=644358 RepID=A0A0C4DMM0_MAGP6|nr:phytase [Magnaporthiopsis poae ATCC 64411]
MDRLRDPHRQRYKYRLLPASLDDEELARTTSVSASAHSLQTGSSDPAASHSLQTGGSDPAATQSLQTRSRRSFRIALLGAFIMVLLTAAVALFALGYGAAAADKPCDSPTRGFQCHPDIARFWGQTSPWFSVPSEIDASLPVGCEITFAQVLSRHGARDPTAKKSQAYKATIARIQSSVTKYGDGFTFLKDYKYKFGADQLSDFGRNQMLNSGIHFYGRYRALARTATPFIRASGQQRIIESGDKWAQGFHQARVADGVGAGNDGFPYPKVLISEAKGSNNTLDHGLCTAFEKRDKASERVFAKFLASFGGPIQDRLNKGLPGANITLDEVVHLMDLCPFESVARTDGKLSEFCGLFTKEEWRSYDYMASLNKYYSYGQGSALGPTQGVGFTNELLARLTGKPVSDRTSTNRTLTSNPATFPLGKKLYADFSHDNDMLAIYNAIGLYNATTITQARAAAVFIMTSESITRMYVEKMKCGATAGQNKELVRILVNDRVIPLQNCGADKLGRCELNKFVNSLSFARGGGHWDKCFV